MARRKWIRECNQFNANVIEECARSKRSLQQQQRELCYNIRQQCSGWYEGRPDPAIICNSCKFLWNGLGLVCVAARENLAKALLIEEE